MLNPPVSKRDHTIGPSNAEVVMVEYGDFECPHCAAAEPVFRALRETLSDSLLFAYPTSRWPRRIRTPCMPRKHRRLRARWENSGRCMIVCLNIRMRSKTRI